MDADQHKRWREEPGKKIPRIGLWAGYTEREPNTFEKLYVEHRPGQTKDPPWEDKPDV